MNHSINFSFVELSVYTVTVAISKSIDFNQKPAVLNKKIVFPKMDVTRERKRRREEIRSYEAGIYTLK